MSKWAALAGSNGATAAAVVVVAAAAMGAGVYFNSGETSDAPPVTTVSKPADEQVPVTEEVAVVEPQADTDAAPAANPPSIDEVRVEPDGLTVIAGRAAPGSKVAVLLDGAENTETTADDGGSFAAITILPPSDKAQVLTIVQRVGADEIASADEVILAPQKAPVAVADVVEDTPAPTQPEATEGVAVVYDPAPQPQDETDVADASAQDASDAEPVETASLSTDETPLSTEAEEVNTAPQVPEVTEETQIVNPEVAPEAIATATAETPEEPVAAEEEVAATTDALAEDAPAVDAPATTTTTEVTVLRSTAEGVEVLSNTPPEALDNIALDAISYSDAGDVELAGRAQSEADAVRVYVNNRPIADIDVAADGRGKGELPQIVTATYTLRVDELDEDGAVTSRVETPFRREDPEVLAQASDSTAPATQITVQAGNTLWAIARDRYGEGLRYVQVFDANRDRIRNPDLIFPGQVFSLPD
ncbi:MAG: LysM peptidoglycan-binding domain-containing protein [Tateyamaria sp.]